MAGSPVLGVLGAVALLGLSSHPAHAAPPSNDGPGTPGQFELYAAANGNPEEQQAVAELAEATADPGVPRCLGPSSFDRTVWFRVPEAPEPREISVEAVGRSLEPVDLAAFVQPPATQPPPPPVTAEPNACAGAGAGGSDAAEDPASAVTIRVPAHRPVLIQVGRRGPRASAEHERALLSLRTEALLDFGTPAGDRASLATPTASVRRLDRVDLVGATLTEEDPAQPPCPSMGTVWRRFVLGRSERKLIRASGLGVETLTVFSGERPTGDNVLDCVTRSGAGALEMVVEARKRRPVWVRLGTDEPPEDAEAVLRIAPGAGRTVVDGGPGGSDPTPGGPAGGLPPACERARTQRARIRGRSFFGTARRFNRFRTVGLSLRTQGASVCEAVLRLVGPRGRIYARGEAIRLTGRRVVRLRRVRAFKRGRYKLTVTAPDSHGRPMRVRTLARGRLA